MANTSHELNLILFFYGATSLVISNIHILFYFNTLFRLTTTNSEINTKNTVWEMMVGCTTGKKVIILEERYKCFMFIFR